MIGTKSRNDRIKVFRMSSEVGPGDDIVYPSAIPFVLVHIACIGAIWSGVTLTAVAIGVALYVVRIFAIGAGYHRYFSHRAYSTSRVFQFMLAFLPYSLERPLNSRYRRLKTVAYRFTVRDHRPVKS